MMIQRTFGLHLTTYTKAKDFYVNLLLEYKLNAFECCMGENGLVLWLFPSF